MYLIHKIQRELKALENTKREFTTPIVRRGFGINLNDLATPREFGIIRKFDIEINRLRGLYLRVVSLEAFQDDYKDCNKSQVRAWNELNAIRRAV